jgi:cell division protein FtsB
MFRIRRRRSRSALAVRWLGAAVVLAIAAAYVHPLRSYREARSLVAQKKTEVKQLAKANGVLERRLSLAGTEEFVLREARKLGLVRTGERLYIVKGVERERKVTRGGGLP